MRPPAVQPGRKPVRRGWTRLDGEKRRQWVKIRQEAPDVADFLAALGEEFGKLAAVRVELQGGDVIESGVIDEGGEVWDGKLRRMKYSEGWK